MIQPPASGPAIAATPKTVEQLRGLGYEVVVESGAGARASFADAAYEEAGARVASQDDVWASDLVLKINAPSDEEIARIKMFIDRFRYQATKAAQVQSRIKLLEKVVPIEVPPERKRIHFRFPPCAKSGRTVLDIRHAS